MARLPVAGENSAVGAIFTAATEYYLSLHSGDPGTTGANEISGGSYARQGVSLGAASGGVMTSSGTFAAQNFTNMPAEASGCPYFGIWSAASGGTYLGGGTTSGLSGAIPAGATVAFAAGAITAAIS